MFLLSILIAAAPTAPDEAIREHAAQCGLSPNQIVWTTEKDGTRTANISPNGDLDSLPFSSLKCMLDWAKQSGAKVGFISEPPSTAPKPIELVTPDVAASRVAACGFSTVRPRFDDLLQEDVIEVAGVISASDEQLRCAALASLSSHYYVVFPDTVERTYQPLYWRLAREQGKADARAWLEKRGLLSRLPMFDPQRSDENAFARALETLCGPKAAGTLQPMKGMATFKSDALASGRLDDETLWCLTNAAEASGYPLGFIGNEANQQNR